MNEIDACEHSQKARNQRAGTRKKKMIRAQQGMPMLACQAATVGSHARNMIQRVELLIVSRRWLREFRA